MKTINIKNLILVFTGSFLYFLITFFLVVNIVIKVLIESNDLLSIVVALILSMVTATIISIFYIFNSYHMNIFIYKFKIIILLFPILIFMTSFLFKGVTKIKQNSDNKKIETEFNKLETIININNLIIKIDPASKKVYKLIKNSDKYKVISYDPITLSDVKINPYTKYRIFELEKGYVLAVEDNLNKNYYVESLDKENNFYQLNLNLKNLKDEYKNISLNVINDDTKYQSSTIDGHYYLSTQEGSSYVIYRKYFLNLYFVFKKIPLKEELKKNYKDISSISYSNDYSKLTINNEIKKIYAKMDEKFNIILYEQETIN
ncbi:MAG: hypothetical protein RR708_00115 [Bacilli bacterium]